MNVSRVKIKLGKRNIEEYVVEVKKQTECTLYAASELVKYVFRATGKSLQTVFSAGESPAISIDCGEEFDDGFSIRFEGENLLLKGLNERSALYAVYELLEKFGWRFFSDEAAYRMLEVGKYMFPCEAFLSKTDVEISKSYETEQKAAIAYRDGWSFALKNSNFCAKMRLNAGTWETRNMSAQFGGSREFAHDAGHTFIDLLPIVKFGNTHPEFFAEIDGKRASVGDIEWQRGLTNWKTPQFCLTNFDSVPYVVETLKEWMQKEPWSEYVSVSQNDNLLFCQCEKCKKSYDKYGKFGTLIHYVNKVAEEMEKDYPTLKIQTYSYWGTDDVTDCVKAHKNVVVQWCPVTVCRNHALDDPNCALNKKQYEKLCTLSKVTDNIFIFDYRACMKYAMLTFTDLFTLRQTMRAYAENHVTGLYSEVCLSTLNQPTFEELRAYLFGKLTWNPYMSDEEYERHIDEFLEGFYGAGWRHIRAWLEKWSAVNPAMHYTSFYGAMVDDNVQYVRDEKGEVVYADFVAKEKVKEICDFGNACFDEATKSATKEQKTRIEIARTGVIWYELYHTMKDVMESGDEKAKAEMTARTQDLCARMRKYALKYTIGTGMKNISYMYDDFSLPVSDWDYTGNIAGEMLPS